MGLFPLEDVRTMVFELSLIRSAFMRGAVLTQAGYKVAVCIIGKVDIAA